MMQVIVRETGRVLTEEGNTAYRFWPRFKGLMLQKQVRALHLQPCKRVHTWFMRVPIDVVYLDKDLRITGVEASLAPYRLGAAFPGTTSVLELSEGSLEAMQLDPGQHLLLEERAPLSMSSHHV
ncbi:DUF192 domain-containing protein [Bacillus daqingensis]|uniref:DUF192 domain-containing protein n=1 Tax=Bacillus daqingensis TaxID=872396 RepID=A0ABV9NYR7_9BACI